MATLPLAFKNKYNFKKGITGMVCFNDQLRTYFEVYTDDRYSYCYAAITET